MHVYNASNDEEFVTKYKLKPCPFCGKIPNMWYDENWDEYTYPYTIRCCNWGCPISSCENSGNDPDKLAEEWNTRAFEPISQIKDVDDFEL